ncbi:MAG: 50S ribosomal protein L23 [Rickettsiales bacterium]|jgi:large subunit ribosomal protein L23|nr:50S ribosomal protein L23 [Rickettsiales bacterium]
MSLGHVYDIIISQLMTEKTNLQLAENKFVVQVLPTATKKDIKKAVETIFSLEVEKINIIVTPAKAKKFKGLKGFRRPTRKAIVSLKKGQKVDLAKLETTK